MKINQTAVTKEELQQRALEYSATVVSDETKQLQLLIFTMEGQLFACSTEELQETLPLQKIVCLPEMHQSLSGLINLRGSLLLTFDLRRFLGLSTTAKIGHILVVKSGHNQTGLIVESVSKVDTVSQSIFQSGVEITSGVPPSYILGIGMYKKTPLLWLDIRKIIVHMELILADS